MDVANGVAIVTGAAGSIGTAIVGRLLGTGLNVVAVDRTSESLQTMESALGTVGETRGCLETCVMDITSEAACDALSDRVSDRFGRASVVINNAGSIRRTPTMETPLNEWHAIVETNLTGAFLVTRAMLPLLKRNGSGCIINISSRAALRPHPNATPAYGASKAGLLYLTRHWALEFVADGIRVNAVLPGPVKGAMFDQLGAEIQEEVVGQIPLGRPADPKEIAGVVNFLVSQDAAYITGQWVHVNGGSFMG